jgi:hypothetical protein
MDPSTLANSPHPPAGRLRRHSGYGVGSWRGRHGEPGVERRAGGRANYSGELIAKADRLHAGTMGAAECGGRAGAVAGGGGAERRHDDHMVAGWQSG